MKGRRENRRPRKQRPAEMSTHRQRSEGSMKLWQDEDTHQAEHELRRGGQNEPRNDLQGQTVSSYHESLAMLACFGCIKIRKG